MVMITTVPVFPLLYSSFDGDVNDLDLGDEVEYTVTRKSAKLSAENIRKVPKGTVAPEVSGFSLLNVFLNSYFAGNSECIRRLWLHRYLRQ